MVKVELNRENKQVAVVRNAVHHQQYEPQSGSQKSFLLSMFLKADINDPSKLDGGDKFFPISMARQTFRDLEKYLNHQPEEKRQCVLFSNPNFWSSK